MLDVGFSEILLTSAIALIVLGPEKLPKVARQVGNWVGRARAMARQLTEQLEREVSADELMKQTKPSNTSSNNYNAGAAKTSAPSAVDTSYIPNDPPPVVTPPPAAAPAAVYSPETAAAVHGADWHASPPENKPANE
jgi:sec-independent protein translocase protein TatB